MSANRPFIFIWTAATIQPPVIVRGDRLKRPPSDLTTRVIFHAPLDNYEFRPIVQVSVVKPRRNGDYGLTVSFPREHYRPPVVLIVPLYT